MNHSRRRKKRIRPVIILIIVLAVVLLALIGLIFIKLSRDNGGFGNVFGGRNDTASAQTSAPVFTTPAPTVDPVFTTPASTEKPVATPVPTPAPTPVPTPTPMPTPMPVADFDVQQGRMIPIIAYLNVNDGTGPEYRYKHHDSMKPETFTEQLQYIKDNGYTPLWFEDLAELENVEKPVMITFDGCWADQYNVAWPIIKSEGIKINLMVWPGFLDTEEHFTTAQLKEMAASGLVSVQAAMDCYADMEAMTTEELEKMITEARDYVADFNGREPLAMAYSLKNTTQRAVDICKDNFKFGVRRNAQRGYDTTADETELIWRYTIMRETTMQEYAYWLSKSK